MQQAQGSGTERIRKGDVVVLKSGGPKMTVQNLGESKPGLTGPITWVHCMWFDGNTICEYNFDACVLKHAE
jgi:uncharacterized protein YodC (DUF2158 family)